MLLPDVNVMFALVYAQHEHADAANTLYRLLTQRAAMRTNVLEAGAAWQVWDELLRDDRFRLIEEPPGIEAEWRHLCASMPHDASVNTGTYLAAFAQASDARHVRPGLRPLPRPSSGSSDSLIAIGRGPNDP